MEATPTIEPRSELTSPTTWPALMLQILGCIALAVALTSGAVLAAGMF